MECDPSGSQGRVSSRSYAHPQMEGDYNIKSSYQPGKGAIVASDPRWSDMGDGKHHAWSIPIFVQFYEHQRWCYSKTKGNVIS